MLHITKNYALQTLCGEPHKICNDEGCLLNLPTNRPLVNPETGEIYDVVQGTFFLCGAPESSEHFTSLTEEELAKFSKEFSLSKLLYLLSFT